MDNSIVYLHVTYWEGLARPYYHLYGKLYPDGIDVQYELSKEEADILNAQDRGLGEPYKKGDLSTRFLDITKLRKTAIKCAKEDFVELKILFEGEKYVVEPKMILYCSVCSEQEVKELNTMFAEFDKLDWDSVDEEQRKEEIAVNWYRKLHCILKTNEKL